MEEISIHRNLALVAKNVVVNADINNLTKNQIKRVITQVKQGYATSGDATTSYITRSILREYNLPHFILGNNSEYISWKNIPKNHAMFESLEKLVSITKMEEISYANQKTWRDKAVKEIERVLEERPTTGTLNLSDTSELIRDKVYDACRYELSDDHTVNELLTKLPDMSEFPIVIGREEYSYKLPYDEQVKDEDEFFD